jgi:hypothetical protein
MIAACPTTCPPLRREKCRSVSPSSRERSALRCDRPAHSRSHFVARCSSIRLSPSTRERLRRTDPELWLDRHGDALYRYALLRLRAPDATADVVQETFVEALRARHSFVGRSSERTGRPRRAWVRSGKSVRSKWRISKSLGVRIRRTIGTPSQANEAVRVERSAAHRPTGSSARARAASLHGREPAPRSLPVSSRSAKRTESRWG